MSIVLLIAWAVGVNVMAYRLRRYLVDRDRTEFFGLVPRQVYIPDLFRPSRFEPEGEPLRRIAMGWFTVGLLIFLVATMS